MKWIESKNKNDVVSKFSSRGALTTPQRGVSTASKAPHTHTHTMPMSVRATTYALFSESQLRLTPKISSDRRQLVFWHGLSLRHVNLQNLSHATCTRLEAVCGTKDLFPQPSM
eukprot:1590911-Amphidinium_carterae.1